MKTYRLEREDGLGKELPDPRFLPRGFAYGGLGRPGVRDTQEVPEEASTQPENTPVREEWLQARQRRAQQEEEWREARKQLVYPELGAAALHLDQNQ